MATELDDDLDGGVERKIDSAANSGVAPDSETALSGLVIGDVPTRRAQKATNSPSSSAPSVAAPARAGSRAALAAQLTEKEQEIAGMKERLEALEARSNTQAVEQLGAIIATGVSVSSQFLAEKRGPHWLFDHETEATPIGQAWAPVLAPYADKIVEYAPWILACVTTWGIVKPKLDIDRAILEAKKAEQERQDAAA